MENIYSALVLHSLGKEINEDAVEKLIKAAGGSADKTQIKVLVKAVGEMNIKEVLASAATMAAAPAAAPAAPAEEKKGKGKKEEKKEEEKKEEEPVGLDALFG